jgi:hypothetical protein
VTTAGVPEETGAVSPRLRTVLCLVVAGAVLLFPGGLLDEALGAWFRRAMNLRIASALASGGETGKISLDECVLFRWDRAVFVGPYESPERVSRLLGADVSESDLGPLPWYDHINGFVFVSGTKVRLITFGRQRGRLDGISQTRVFTPGRFKIAYRIDREPGRAPEFMFDDRADGK